MSPEKLFKDDENKTARILSFGAPTGGVGTTLLASNLGIQLAKKGRNVLLVDAALSEASCHLALGMMRPEVHLGSLARKKVEEIGDAVVATPIQNLFLLAGSPDIPEAANMAYLVKQKILAGLREADYDYILIDSGSGTDMDTLDFMLSADTAVLPCQATQPGLEPFYRFVRALLHRLIQTTLNKKRYAELADKLNWESPFNGLAEVEGIKDGDLDALESRMKRLALTFVVTGAQAARNGRLGAQVEALLRRYFLVPFRYLGPVDWDEQASSAAESLEAISKAYPMCAFSMAVERLANLLLKEEKEPPPAESWLQQQREEEENAYELLDLPFNAMPKDIQAAYTRKLEPYLETSNLTIGLLTKEEREMVRDRLEEAYKTLISSSFRIRYDDDLISRGLMTPEQRVSEYREPPKEGASVPPSPPPDQEAEIPAVEDTASRRIRTLESLLKEIKAFDGPALRLTRESQNISVEEIVSETNIRSWYIQCIEEENFDALPAVIYLKAFLKQIADYLHLDPDRVLNDYMARYSSWREEHPE